MKIERADGEVVEEFTFHYGPIQIATHARPLIFLSLFTFHYGPIQIKSKILIIKL